MTDLAHVGDERLRRLDRLFAAALELPEPERRHYIERSLADDPALRVVGLDLLDADGRERHVVDELRRAVAAPLAAAIVEGEEPVGPGTTLGAYRLERAVARGGTGTVFLARRTDGEFEQQVAVKVLRRGLDTDDTLLRFRTERQILAALVHPYIAGLIDGGSTPDGRPYLVMEYVDGAPITAYATSRALSLEERLQLFLKVADAVRYAHGRLVVHRDIKPSNILVMEEGTPRLLDFGIARLLDPSSFAFDSPRTQAGVSLLTPRYASPEQLRGERVGTASDVYQLGVLLYELLSGVHPVADHLRNPAAIEAALMREDYLRPSDAVCRTVSVLEPGSRNRERLALRLRKRLRGDLDAIVAHAMRAHPEQRYRSVEQLMTDVERHLRGLPILARGEGRWYRGRKLLRRHPIAAAVAGMLLLGSGSHAAVLWRHADRLAAERDRASIEAAKAGEVTAFLVDLFDQPEVRQSTDRPLTVRELIERGTARLRDEERLSTDPTVRASMLQLLGRVHTSLGAYESALPLLEEALVFRRAAHGDAHVDVARAAYDLGRRHELARNWAAADTAYGLALAVYNAIATPDSLAVASLFMGLAATWREMERADEAEALVMDALRIREERLGRDHQLYASSLTTLAYVLRARGELDSAEALYRTAIPVHRARDDHAALASTLNNLGFLLRVRGDHAAAAQSYREALDHAHRAHGPAHPFSLMVMMNLARALDLGGEHDTAETLLRDRIVIAEGRGDEEPWRVGSAQGELGAHYLERGDPERAARWFAAALETYRQTLGGDHPWAANAANHLAESLELLGRFTEAEQLLLWSDSTLRVSGHRQAQAIHRRTLERLAELYEGSSRDEAAARKRARLASLENPPG